MGLFDLVDVGLCQWWMFGGGVGLGCRFVLVWWMWVCADLSGFFFFLRWPSVLLRQWLLVAVGVVAAVVVGGRCCSSGGCAVVVDDDNDKDKRR